MSNNLAFYSSCGSILSCKLDPPMVLDILAFYSSCGTIMSCTLAPAQIVHTCTSPDILVFYSSYFTIMSCTFARATIPFQRQVFNPSSCWLFMFLATDMYSSLLLLSEWVKDVHANVKIHACDSLPNWLPAN